MKTLNECKEKVAVKHGYKDWETCINDQPNYKVESFCDEAAELYAACAWEEGCASMKATIIDYYTHHFPIDTAQVEFTPEAVNPYKQL